MPENKYRIGDRVHVDAFDGEITHVLPLAGKVRVKVDGREAESFLLLVPYDMVTVTRRVPKVGDTIEGFHAYAALPPGAIVQADIRGDVIMRVRGGFVDERGYRYVDGQIHGRPRKLVFLPAEAGQ